MFEADVKNGNDRRAAFRESTLGRRKLRRGAGTLDYVLLMGTVLPLVALLLFVSPRIVKLVYDMTSVMLASPFS